MIEKFKCAEMGMDSHTMRLPIYPMLPRQRPNQVTFKPEHNIHHALHARYLSGSDGILRTLRKMVLNQLKAARIPHSVARASGADID